MEEIKVLLVDDEEDFVRTLAERIRMRDLNSDVALNGQEALRIVEDDIPDVMVLDLRMPGSTEWRCFVGSERPIPRSRS